jgi:hypothetical protein
MCAVRRGETIVGEEPGNGSFRCHPECLKRSYWRRVLLEIEEEIRGLRPGQFVELVLAVDEAESESWWGDRPASKIGRKAAVELFLRGWLEPEIDQAFGFPHGATAQVLEESRIHPKARDIVAAHLEGDPPSRISRDVSVGMAAIYDVLGSIGEEPHRVRDLAKSADINRAVKRRYEEGWSYRQTAEHLGITEQSVRQRIQYMRRKGRIEQPPRESGRRRLRSAE